MLISSFPNSVDWHKFSDQRARITAQPKLSAFVRFSQALSKVDTELLDLDLQFERDAQRRVIVKGRLQADIFIDCQRCLTPMPYSIDASMHVYLLRSSLEERDLGDADDTLIVDDPMLDLKKLVEDELLLQLPLTSYHPQDECEVKLDYGQDTVENKPQQQQRKNPFAVLETLKKDS